MPRPLTTTARGYGAAHQRERQRWQRIIDREGATCWRCRRPIPIGSRSWDLGHHDQDRTRYMGPECPPCNRAAGARKGNARRPGRRRLAVTSLRW